MSENKIKGGWLKKYWKVIASFALIFALLGSAYIVIENYDPTEKPAEETPTPQIPLLSMDASLVMQVEIQNSTGTFAFVRDEASWLVKNAPYILLNQSRVESMCFAAATLSAERLIVSNATDLSAYGLQNPQATVTLTSQNGNTAVFSVGNLTPSGDGYYACLFGEKNVYMLPTATAGSFCGNLNTFRVMTITAFNHLAIRSVSITHGGETLHIRYEAPPEGAYPGAVSTWRMESPLKRNADNTAVQEKILSPISMLVAIDVAADNPKDLSLYGFQGDTVTVSTDTETVRFSVGYANDNYYIMVDGNSAVYAMGKTLPFMTVTPFDVLEKETNLIPLDTVETIEMHLPGVSATLRVAMEGEIMRFFVDDVPAKEDAFKYLYMEIAGLSVDGLVQSPVKTEGKTPEASIVYTLTDGSATTLSYYPYDGFHYALYENGECNFFIKKTRISALADSLRKFVQNPNG